ncbi:hypothetical protein K435DRAFT_807580 [Dendrothele bispora CBS 962.96]|uniref:DUF4100 domain-containing protein n=1 Tax=Dendrothele bispora (strain CBS 962.96) TaxID=1314807 RepID=A0A4S8L4L5_DENBC|nr:hypothetical protein K435DRAFT_807580 [Dendrothele bispora CBS 962.96]
MATALVCVPMPIPGAPGAPVFNGDRASDFLVLVEQLDTIQWMEEFDSDLEDKTWEKAAECLKSLYSSRDKAPQVTRKDLENFYDVDNYRITFSKFSAPLVKNNKIRLPNTTLEWFHGQLTPDKRYASSAPSVEETVKIIKQRYDHNTIFYKPWTTSDDKTKRVRFDLDGQRVESSGESKTTDKKTGSSKSTPTVDDLTKHFQDMQINQTNMFNTAINQLTRAIRQGNDSNPTLHSSQNTTQPGYEILRRCFICGETNTHPMHPSRCHLMPGLLRDNLVKINPTNQRYQLLDGNDLPKLPRDYEGGVAGFLRRQQTTNPPSNTQQSTQASFRREQPPHMGSVSNIGLSYEGIDVFDSDVFAISSPETFDCYSYPTLRSKKDTSNRYDPKARPRTDDQARQNLTPKTQAEVPSNDPQTSVPSTSRQPPQIPSQKPVEVPQPKNPINREDGWKGSKPSNSKGKEKEDVSMKDGTSKGPSYHFTSTLSEKANFDGLYNKIMETEIAIPVGQLIGVSPGLQKMVAEATRTKREYKTKAAEYHDSETEIYFETGREPNWDSSMSPNVCVGNTEQLPSFLVKYTSAVSSMSEKFYGMVTGKMEITINGVSLTAMIDSGSELNLVGRDIPDRAGLPIDFEGMKWTLRGVSGGPERLKGVVTDVPMMLGKHEFSHHLFVANSPLEGQDIILGQPFLNWFAARLDYWRDGVAKLYLWKDGDKSQRPTLSIVITDPTDKRNTTVIDRNVYEAKIVKEDDYEEDF